MSDYRWSLGTLIGLPAMVLLLVVLLAIGAWLLWRRPEMDSYDRGPALVLAVISFIAALATILGTAWGMWPYDGEYHQWRQTSGVVESIDSRLLSGSNGNGPTERFVVTFDDGRQRSCDDTRCAQVEEGDALTIACKRAWQWSGTHGYDCTYVSHRPVR